MKNVFIYLFILLPGVIFCQPDLRFVNYTVDHGLINDDVISICQDQYGFMWFGTKDGCSRFDGIRFKNYQNNGNKAGAISPGWVNGIVIDKKTGYGLPFPAQEAP